MTVTSIALYWHAGRFAAWLSPAKYIQTDSAGRVTSIYVPLYLAGLPRRSGYVTGIDTFVSVRRKSDGVEIGNHVYKGRYTSSKPNSDTIRVSILPTDRDEILIVSAFAQGEPTSGVNRGVTFSAPKIIAQLNLRPNTGEFKLGQYTALSQDPTEVPAPGPEPEPTELVNVTAIKVTKHSGNIYSFEIMHTGTAVAYQWKYDGTPVDGVTGKVWSNVTLTGGHVIHGIAIESYGPPQLADYETVIVTPDTAPEPEATVNVAVGTETVSAPVSISDSSLLALIKAAAARQNKSVEEFSTKRSADGNIYAVDFQLVDEPEPEPEPQPYEPPAFAWSTTILLLVLFAGLAVAGLSAWFMFGRKKKGGAS